MQSTIRSNYEKIYIIITVMFMITLLLCTGCSSDKINININQNSEEYIANEDYQYFLDSYSSFIKTDGGYYFVTDLKLYFYDTEKRSHIPCAAKQTVSTVIRIVLLIFRRLNIFRWQE